MSTTFNEVMELASKIKACKLDILQISQEVASLELDQNLLKSSFQDAINGNKSLKNADARKAELLRMTTTSTEYLSLQDEIDGLNEKKQFTLICQQYHSDCLKIHLAFVGNE